MVPFKSLVTVSYSHSIATGRIFCRFDEIHKRDRHPATQPYTSGQQEPLYAALHARLYSRGKYVKMISACHSCEGEVRGLPCPFSNVTVTVSSTEVFFYINSYNSEDVTAIDADLV